MRWWLVLGMIGGLCSACGNTERNANQGPPPNSGGTAGSSGAAGSANAGSSGTLGSGGSAGNAGMAGSGGSTTPPSCSPICQVQQRWGASGRAHASGVAFDAQGNIFTMGDTIRTGDQPLQNVTGYTDSALLKWSPSGTPDWATWWGSTSYDVARTVATDAAGNIYSVALVDEGLGGSTLVGLADVGLAKHDPQGAPIWMRSLGSNAGDDPTAITVNTMGDAYVAGYASAAFDGQTAVGGMDGFLSKWNTDGVKQWSRAFGSPEQDAVNGVAVDAGGNVYVAGWTEGALYDQVSSGLRDAFLSKWSAAGDQLWTRQWGTAHTDRAEAVAATTSGIYVSGISAMEIEADGYSLVPGTGDAFVALYDLDGQQQWLETIAGETEERQARLAASPDGGAMLVVASTSALPQRVSMENTETDLFLIRVTSSGSLEYLYGWGTEGWEEIWEIDVDSTGQMVAAVGYSGGGGDVAEAQFLSIFELH